VHGLVNRSIQCFVADTQGPEAWARVAALTRSGIADYESLLNYPDTETEDLLAAAGRGLDKTREHLLEDIGTWLVTADDLATLRRLLRFGGPDFVEFLHSLDDLPGRARMAVSGLDLPAMELREHAPLTYSLTLGAGMPGFGHVLMGLLQAMADDYGVLALFSLSLRPAGDAVLQIRVFRTDHAEGNAFDLTMSPG
jgi:hypothetical protein